MAKPRSRRHQLLAIVGGRAVCVTELLSLEIERVEQEVLPMYRERRARGDLDTWGELEAWFTFNAAERARKALGLRRVALMARSYAELRKFEREEAQS